MTGAASKRRQCSTARTTGMLSDARPQGIVTKSVSHLFVQVCLAAGAVGGAGAADACLPSRHHQLAAGDADLIQRCVVTLPRKARALELRLLRLHLWPGRRERRRLGRHMPDGAGQPLAWRHPLAVHGGCGTVQAVKALRPHRALAATGLLGRLHSCCCRPQTWCCPLLGGPHLLLEAAHLRVAGAGGPAHPVACRDCPWGAGMNSPEGHEPLHAGTQAARPTGTVAPPLPLPTCVALRWREGDAILAESLNAVGGCGGAGARQSRAVAGIAHHGGQLSTPRRGAVPHIQHAAHRCRRQLRPGFSVTAGGRPLCCQTSTPPSPPASPH